jgi:cysteine desulfurase
VALALFDLNGLQISAGSACSSGASKPSMVLLQMGLSEVAKNGLRLSLPFEVENDFMEKVKDKFHKIFSRLRS